MAEHAALGKKMSLSFQPKDLEFFRKAHERQRSRRERAANRVTRYNTIWRRIGAMVVDALVMAPVLWVGLTYYRFSYGTPIGIAWAIGTLVFSTAYFVYFHGRYGQTIGKRVLQIRVVSAMDEGRIGYVAALRRESPWIAWGILTAISLHWMLETYPIGATAISNANTLWSLADVVVILLHPKRRAIHDLIGGTVVVRAEPKPPEPTTMTD